MRLTSEQIATVQHTVRSTASQSIRAIVFGCRQRDDAREDDLDLLPEADQRISLLRNQTPMTALQ